MANVIILDFKTPSVQYLCKKDKHLAKVIKMVGPLSYIAHDEKNAYAFLIHEIIEQMLSKKAGSKIFERLNKLCDGAIKPENVNALSDDQIKSIGTSNSKIKYIRGITEAVLSGKLDFKSENKLADEQIIEHLTNLYGIGKWTAKMYLIFVLNRQDVLPYEDVAFLQGYKWVYKTNDLSPESVKRKCKKWKPYSSIAARFLYRALDSGLTKAEFHLYK